MSALLREQVDRCKEQIYAQIDSILNYCRMSSTSGEGIRSQGFENTENQESLQRYSYPFDKKYYLFENNLIFSIVGGRNCEASKARDFKISINELIAFQMNSEAKFSKVYCEGVNQCFLMPADFKDDVMRNFYNLKFEKFQKFGENADFLREDN